MIIGGKRMCGKTTRAILKSSESGALIVTASRDIAKCIEKQAKEMGVTILKPLGYDDFISCQRDGLRCDEIIIDEVDLVLNKALNVKNIILATTSNRMEELEALHFESDMVVKESLFDKTKRLHNVNKDKLTEEESKVIELLDSEVLVYSEIGYNRIERKLELSEHRLLRAKRIASYYEKQGFNVELWNLPFNEFKISIGWGE